MELNYIDNLAKGGFNFDNCLRNKVLTEKGLVSTKAPMKTGTTIVGLVFKVNIVINFNRMEWLLLLILELREGQL
jgi:hypothetical protein